MGEGGREGGVERKGGRKGVMVGKRRRGQETELR